MNSLKRFTKADAVHSNEASTIERFLQLAFCVHRRQRTSKPVFRTRVVKWHAVYAAAVVTPYCSKNIQERRTTAARSQEWLLAE
jgi:hypothetical protein